MISKFAVFLFGFSSALAIGDDGVLALDSSTFSSTVGKDKPALVEFYAPWCGHCKNLAPEYAKVAETFKGASSSVVIAKVDADTNKDLGSQFDVQGFPTLKWFPAGSLKPIDVETERSADALVKFVNEKTGLNKKLKTEPTSVVALTADTFDGIFMPDSPDGSSSTHKLIEFYAPWCGHCKQLAPTWEKLATAFDGEKRVVIAKVDADTHRSLGERFGVTGFPTIKYFPPGKGSAESLVTNYEGGRDLINFVEFLNEKSGTERTPEGNMKPEAGRLSEFDSLAGRFMTAKASDKSAVLKSAKSAEAELESSVEKDKAEVYLKIMQKELDKAGYIQKETNRLHGMIDKEGISKSKKAELQIKLNVLGAFTETAE
jgi:protein disulfide-isomerase A6